MFKDGIKLTKLDQNEIIQVGDKRDTAKLVEEFYSDNPFPNYDISRKCLGVVLNLWETVSKTISYNKITGISVK